MTLGHSVQPRGGAGAEKISVSTVISILLGLGGMERTITNKQKLRLRSDWWYPRTPYHPSLAPGQAGGDSAAETWGWVPKMRPTRPKKGKQGEHRVSGACRGPNDTPGPPTGTQCVALTCHCTPRGFLRGCLLLSLGQRNYSPGVALFWKLLSKR